MFFRDVCKPILPGYNLVSAMLWRHPENFELTEWKLSNIVLRKKTWIERTSIQVLVKKWWEIYEDESLDYMNITMPPDQEKLGPLIAALTEDGVISHRNLPPAA
ncbi:GLYCOGENIN SUBFAMILY MEMBER [Salix viminalis]|uniref:GLYCOGENIN SUBFAMILY MEMBER n=1 Tax=Salix viminalis TaxID=40686 RepID=A0A9Q0Z4A6_SALVM|nr:GLYCOGENIN SUBFAMILY MEMBER [Salix viminalis]